jgi:hypothetical protein
VSTIAYLPWWGRTSISDRLSFAPVALSDAVAEDVPAGSRLLVEQGWGSWFEYARPEMTVFVDSRFEVVPEQIWEDYSTITTPKAAWREVLQRWNVDAIVAKSTWKVLPLLRADPDWKVAFEDADGVVFVRR